MPRNDDADLATIAAHARSLGRTPRRNELMRLTGWGAPKASRLLAAHLDQHETRSALAAIETTIAHLEKERDWLRALLRETRGTR